MSASIFTLKSFADIQAPLPASSWGDWKFDPETLTLENTNRRASEYWIAFANCNSSGQLLDWIFQITNKRWCDEKTTKDLLTAIQEILRPQTNYCPYGTERQADGKALAKNHAARLAGSTP